ncbi:MAG: response regulator [Hyphomicrobium sp.]|nr:response regulator [Hyphomicrobium sp.]
MLDNRQAAGVPAFTITMVQPATERGSQPFNAPSPWHLSRAVAPKKILVVDDELWAALDMEWVVQELGHEVIGPAPTAEKAILLAGEHQPDLILMDIRLAYSGDGVAAAVEIRNRFDIGSIFVSAHGDPDTRLRAMAARPSGFIEKPFTPEALSQAIEAALTAGNEDD